MHRLLKISILMPMASSALRNISFIHGMRNLHLMLQVVLHLIASPGQDRGRWKYDRASRWR